jgi:hypothetical protein
MARARGDTLSGSSLRKPAVTSQPGLSSVSFAASSPRAASSLSEPLEGLAQQALGVGRKIAVAFAFVEGTSGFAGFEA